MAINKSLSALGDVIAALSSNEKHIPFRNSKLTHILQDSLGGNSKTLMFVNVNPNSVNVKETINSLNFASRAKTVALGKATQNREKMQSKMTEMCTALSSLQKMDPETARGEPKKGEGRKGG